MVASAQMLAAVVWLTAAAAGPSGPARERTDAAAASSEQTDHSIELLGDSQSFFPSFANLFEPRPSYRGLAQPEAAYSQRPGSYRSLLNYPLFGSYRPEPYSKPPPPAADAVLGSGNFGVLRGGTFGAEDEPELEDFGYFGGARANPRPDHQQEQFANFRDFADINAPGGAYSQAVVVYARDERPQESRFTEPNNIFEALQRLDAPRAPKVSKAKAKLALAKQALRSKKDQWKTKTHHEDEPLLALS